jgi:hypothetical protein
MNLEKKHRDFGHPCLGNFDPILKIKASGITLAFNILIMNEKVSHIKYIDAYYSYDTNLKKVNFPVHEAYGFSRRNAVGDYIIAYIREVFPTPNKIAAGLIIPEGSLLSSFNKAAKSVFNFELNSNVSIKWRDIVIFHNGDRSDSSVMETTGILHEVSDSYVVIKDPKTFRLTPLPATEHPKHHPHYYVIPKSLILEIKTDGKK